MNQQRKQQVVECTFQMQLTQGTGNIKFPCTCYVQWITNNEKDVSRSNNRVKLIQGKLDFNQKLVLTTHMVLDIKSQIYLKKKSLVILNLLSKLKPNEPKLVGRVAVELSKVANQIDFQQLKQYPLQFCAVDATLTFKVSLKEAKATNLGVSELQRSEYGQLQQIVSQKNSRIKSQNQTVKNNPQIADAPYFSRVKKQVSKKQIQQTSKSNILEQVKKSQQIKNGLSVPALSKNVEQFDSNKILSQQVSQRAPDSPLKNGQIQSKHEDQVTQFTITNLQIKQIKTQKEQLTKDLQNNNRQLELVIAQSNQQKQVIQLLKNSVTKRNQQIALLTQTNAQIQQLKQIIQEKDQQIQQISALKNAQKYQFQQKKRLLLNRIDELTQEIKVLQTQANKGSDKASEQTSKAIEQYKSQICETTQTIQDLNYKLKMEEANHQNSKMQLNQVRNWYSELQQQSDNLIREKEHLQSLLQAQRLTKQISRQTAANQATQERQTKIKQLQRQLAQKDNQIAASHELAELLEAYKQNQARLISQLQNIRKEIDELQIKYVQQQSTLHQAQENVKKYAQLLKLSQQQKQSKGLAIRERSEQVQQNKRKLEDLVKRLKQKQQTIVKIQRQSQLLQQKCKVSQSYTQKYKEKVKIAEAEKETQKQKAKLLQKQNKQLKAKCQKDSESFNKQIKRLQLTLQTETNKRSQLLAEIQNKARTGQNSKIKDLQTKIKKYIQKEQLLKECSNNFQEQSNRITIILQQKQQSQDQFANNIITLTQQNHHLTSKINELSNQCLLLHQRNQGLESQIQLLNAYQPNQQQSYHPSVSHGSDTLQLNKKLIEKNKELLQQIQQRNHHIVNLQTLQAEIKGKEAHQILSQSRQEREKQDYMNKYQEVVEENQKLYVEFERLNMKYQDQLNQSNQMSQYKINNLEKKIKQKDTQLAQFQSKSKEQLLKLQRKINQQQYQLQYSSIQIKELTDNIFSLKEQIKEKQLSLELATLQIKQLSQKIQSIQAKQEQLVFTFNKTSNQLQKEAISPKSLQKDKNHQSAQQRDDKNILCEQLQQEISHLKYKVEFYEAEIERLHEKEFILQKDILQANQRFTKVKENSEEQQKHIVYLQSELKNCRQRQSSYIQQIDALEERQNKLKISYLRLEKDNNQLSNTKHQQQTDIQRLTAQLQTQKENKIQSQQSTPINKFKHSPRNSQIDMKEVFAQLDGILIRRKQQQQLENALRLVIDNNTRQQEQFQRWGKERSMIQQKAKLISKQLQKIKSNIMKISNRSIAQKSQLANFLKPAEGVVNDLINLSEHLNEMDPYQEQQQFEGEGSNNNSPR